MNQRRRPVARRLGPAAGPRLSKRPALPAGELRGLVLAHLRAHPQLDFSPTELAKVLGRPTSRGAIMKACRRLVEEGLAVVTQNRPERYRVGI